MNANQTPSARPEAKKEVPAASSEEKENFMNETPLTPDLPTEETGLAPCPFCGSPNVTIEQLDEGSPKPYWNCRIVCRVCWIRTDRYNLAQHKEAMISDWNRRAPLIPVDATPNGSGASSEKEVPSSSSETKEEETKIKWGSWVRGEWDAEEPACVRCHQALSLRAGYEWSDFPELNLCDDCTRIVLEEMRDRASSEKPVPLPEQQGQGL